MLRKSPQISREGKTSEKAQRQEYALCFQGTASNQWSWSHRRKERDLRQVMGPDTMEWGPMGHVTLSFAWLVSHWIVLNITKWYDLSGMV